MALAGQRNHRLGRSMPQAILTINAGSSTIKFAAYETDAGSGPALLYRGLLDRHAQDAEFVIRDADGKLLRKEKAGAWDKPESVLGLLERSIRF
jgi:acetate kinase